MVSLGTSLIALSERQRKRVVYEAMGDTASPGDVVFMITLGHRFAPHQKLWRSWLGLRADDSSKWHTMIYAGMKRERRGGTYRPYVIHSAEQGLRHVGTIEEHVSPGYYTSNGPSTAVLEILSFDGLETSSRERIVEYARGRIGTPHDPRGWQRDALTYAFGLPTISDPGRVSCQALAYEAYGAAGIEFPHQVGTMPWFNLARWRGYPLGHSRRAVNVNAVYLRDHHLYNDARFHAVLSISRTEGDQGILLNPGKYSWLASWKRQQTQPSLKLA